MVPLLGSASGGSFLLRWGQAEIKFLAVEKVGHSVFGQENSIF